MAATVVLDAGALILVAVKRLVRLVATVVLLVADQVIADTLPVGTGKLPFGAGALQPVAAHLVAVIATVVLPITVVVSVDALGVAAGKVQRCARWILLAAILALIRAVAAVVVMVTQPVLVDAAAVAALELLFAALLPWPGAQGNGRVLIRSIHTVRVAVTHPLAGNAHGPVPQLVLRALKLRLRVALPIVALALLTLVRAIQTVIVAIAEIDPRDAVAIVAGEQVAEAGLLVRLTIFLRLVTAVLTIGIAITVPRGRDATVVRTPETVGRAGAGAIVQRVLIAVVATIVVTVAEPVGLHTNGGVLALEVILGTGHVAGAAQCHRLVAGRVVLAVVHAVANLQLRDAAEIVAGVLPLGTVGIVAANLIRPIATVILVVTLPGLEDAAAVAAAILCRSTCVVAAVVILLVT